MHSTTYISFLQKKLFLRHSSLISLGLHHVTAYMVHALRRTKLIKEEYPEKCFTLLDDNEWKLRLGLICVKPNSMK